MTFLASRDTLAGHRVVVISDESGEGALVSEFASLLLNPPATVMRGSKLLASDNWNGQNLHLLYSSSAQVMRELEDLHADYLVMDMSPPAVRLAYWNQITEMLAANGARFEQVHSVPGRPLIIYRLLNHSPGPAKPLRIVTSANRVIEEK